MYVPPRHRLGSFAFVYFCVYLFVFVCFCSFCLFFVCLADVFVFCECGCRDEELGSGCMPPRATACRGQFLMSEVPLYPPGPE